MLNNMFIFGETYWLQTKGTTIGTNSMVLYANFVVNFHRNTHINYRYQNKHHLSLLPLRKQTRAGITRPANNTKHIINKNYLPKLHARYQRLLVSYTGDLRPQPHYQLPGPTDINWQKMSHQIQDLPGGHEYLLLPSTPLLPPTRSTAGTTILTPWKILVTKYQEVMINRRWANNS